VNAPVRFLEMARGEKPDWSAGPQPAASTWVAEFRSNADDLIHYWHQAGDSADAGQVDWQTAEIAVHTWDVARATGQSPPLLPEVAERGLAFMSAMLTPENRGKAFAPAVPVPEDAPAYDRLAALAGRAPGPASPLRSRRTSWRGLGATGILRTLDRRVRPGEDQSLAPVTVTDQVRRFAVLAPHLDDL
jgi:hypothetical protein